MYAVTVPEILRRRAKREPDGVAHHSLDDTGMWRPTTWHEYYERACRLNSGLRKLGLEAGDNVGIMATTSQSWDLLQMGIMMAGAAVIGVDLAESHENVNHVARVTDLRAVVAQDLEALSKMDGELIRSLKFAILIDLPENIRLKPNWCRLDEVDTAEPDYSVRAEPNSLATVIFTSGTTGKPKGIGYTHEQVVLTCASILRGFPDLGPSSSLPCWLPLSNLFQRIVNFCAIEIGASSYYISDPRSIVKALPQVEPHLLIGVPRVFEKLHQAIQSSIESKPWLMRVIVRFAIDQGRLHAKSQREGTRPSLLNRILHKLMDQLVLRKTRSFAGGKLKYMISGSAPMPVWMLEWFHALGILILEAYGVSENIIPNAMNTPGDYKFGTVGRPLPENRVRFLEDGELLVAGRGVIDCYHGDRSPLTEDGFYPTGDYAALDESGYLMVLGRKSEVFKTSTGKKISPAVIERQLQRASCVDHAVVFGRSRKVLVVLVTLTQEFMEECSLDSQTGITPEALDSLAETIVCEIAKLPKHYRPAAVLISKSALSVAEGELTSNLKLRRKGIEEKYASKINQVYEFLNGSGQTDTLTFWESCDLLWAHEVSE